MGVIRRTYTSKKTGETTVKEYIPTRYYYVPAAERARILLKTRPFKRVFTPTGASRWSAGQRGPIFNDSTICKLIEQGYAICFGDFVEMKGVVR